MDPTEFKSFPSSNSHRHYSAFSIVQITKVFFFGWFGNKNSSGKVGFDPGARVWAPIRANLDTFGNGVLNIGNLQCRYFFLHKQGCQIGCIRRRHNQRPYCHGHSEESSGSSSWWVIVVLCEVQNTLIETVTGPTSIRTLISLIGHVFQPHVYPSTKEYGGQNQIPYFYCKGK